jgi:SAM-dependent methyltransferase
MNNDNLKSPITKSDNVRIVKNISAGKIIQLYKKDFGIDVSKYFREIEVIPICECKDTSYRYYYPPSVSGDDSFYEELQKVKGSDIYYSPWRWEHEIVFNQLNKEERVLDIGCGSGNFLEKLKSKTSNIIGLEYNNLAIEKCLAKGLTVYNTGLKEFSEIKENQFKFDIICAFQVLEHIFDVNSFLTSCIKLLGSGGRLIIGVPNNNPYLHKYDYFHTLNLPPHHIGLWNKTSLKKLPKFFPFQLEQLITEPNSHFDYWLDIQAKKWIGINNFSRFLKKIKMHKCISMFSRFTEGRNLLAVYIKN